MTSTPTSSAARLLGCSVFLFTASGCNDARQAPASRAATSLLLNANPDMIDFGTLPRHAQRKGSFTLSNPGMTSVPIARIESSCPCVRARLAQSTISPGGKVELEIELDFREEPDFTGGLLVEVLGQTPEGTLAFSVKISMTVSSDQGS